VKVFGWVLFAAAGIIMFVMEVIFAGTVWGLDGMVAVFFLGAPLAPLFPFILWFYTKTFPFFYFTVWLVGLGGAALANWPDTKRGAGWEA
jgi:hypothetical protein